MILNDSEACTTMYFQSSPLPKALPSKKKWLLPLWLLHLQKKKKTTNYGHRINEVKYKIKMFYIHRAIFHNCVKQKVLLNVYTRTWWKIPDIKLLELRLELIGPPISIW